MSQKKPMSMKEVHEALETMTVLAADEAHELLVAIADRTKSPLPIMLMLDTTRAFIDVSEYEQAAIILDSLYIIADRSQDKIKTYLESELKPDFTAVLYGALVQYFAVVLKSNEDEDGDENETPLGNLRPFPGYASDDEDDDDDYDEECMCDECRTARGELPGGLPGELSDETLLEMAQMLRANGVNVLGFFGKK